jgi:hypothetical protein
VAAGTILPSISRISLNIRTSLTEFAVIVNLSRDSILGSLAKEVRGRAE